VITVELNPQGMEEEFLKYLNSCFGNWGDRRKYDWFFRRKTVYPEADLMILRQDGTLVAGSAVTYRKIALPDDSELTVGIMTGSWTLPPFRQQGCFARIIEESLRLTASKGGALLLGFAVDDRSSFRQLVRAGSATFPCSYIFSTPGTELPRNKSKLSSVKQSGRVVSDMCARLYAGGVGHTRFIYLSEEEFKSQFLLRPCETEIFRDDYGNYGIVEKGEDTDILQLYLAGSDDEAHLTESLAGFLWRALSRGRKLFLYSARQSIARCCSKLGLEVKAGYITTLVADESRLRAALRIPEQATMEDSSRLTSKDSDWFLGRWSVHSGDRA
jgi:hypothetical protein